MAGCQFNVEEIFSRLFTQERFYNATHIPHFLQTFAPPQVQKLSRDVQTLALLQGATLLASVAPDPVPLFDLPPLPNEDSRVSKPGDHLRYVSSSSYSSLASSLSFASDSGVAASALAPSVSPVSIAASHSRLKATQIASATAAVLASGSASSLASASSFASAYGSNVRLSAGSASAASLVASKSSALHASPDLPSVGSQSHAESERSLVLGDSVAAGLTSFAIDSGVEGGLKASLSSQDVSVDSTPHILAGGLSDAQALSGSREVSAASSAAVAQSKIKIPVHQGLNAALKAQHCQMAGNCPFSEPKDGENEFQCKFFVDNNCTCTQAWELTLDQSKCVEAVLPGVSKRVWTAAEFEDARAAVRYGLDEDRIQITLCAPVRHLQHKTQLFPLDVKASVRSRLTHSYEVALYSKISISALVERLPALRPLMYEMMVCVENAALLHDIGRPPVGKFGEQILRQWIKEVCELYDHELSSRQQVDLKAFNGHAQGVRLAHSIYKLNLSLGQLSALIHTPKTYEELRQAGFSEESACKQAGLFLSELPLRERIFKSGLTAKRHPLSWLLEQCDDLAYILGDLDDAYDRGLLKDSEVLELIESLIAYLKDNACNSTCDRCISACTCANGYVFPYRSHAQDLPGAEPIMMQPSNSDTAHASKHGHSYGYGVDPSERDELHKSMQSVRIRSVSDNACAKHLDQYGEIEGSFTPSQDTSSQSAAGTTHTDGSPKAASLKGGRQAGNQAKLVLGGEHDDVLADGLTFIKLDVVIVDAIKHCYCLGKQDSFGVLQLVHGTNPISLTEMMKELGVRTLLSLVRECLVTYYIDDVINAICANQYDFFFKGELNVTHYGNDAHKAIDFLKRFEQHMVYCHEDVESTELRGGRYLKFVLNEYSNMLSVGSTEFLSCLTKSEGDPLISRLCRRIPRRCKEAYLEMCKKDMNLERYARIRLILDTISCMTDPFLASEYETLSGNTTRRLL